jgi:hypothetical protein
MSPGTTNGGPPAGPAIVEKINAVTTQHDHGQHRTRRYVVASATSYPPAGRRSLVLLLVLHCPFCQYVHAHRGAEYGGVRRAGCGRGEYLVKPATAARVPA